MGKKNQLKPQDNEDLVEETAEASKGGKKSKKPRKKAFDEDEIARELEELSLEVNGVVPPNKTENEKQSEGKEKAAKKNEEEGRVSPHIGGGFSALMDDIDGGDFDKEEQTSESSVKQKVKKKEEKVAKPEPPPKKDKSKKKGKRRGNDDDDEELEDLLAEIESEYTGEKKEVKTLDKKEKVEVTDKTSKSEPPPKKEKNKKKSKRRENDDDLDELIAEIESANRGEKKAAKRLNEKEVIDKPSKSKGTKETLPSKNKQSEKTNKQPEKEINVVEEINEDIQKEKTKTDEQDVSKTKAKEEEKEEVKSRKGKPNKKMLEAMKSLIAKQKEEEERRLKIFEEKQRQEEERIRQLEEQRRLEEEKKERQRERQKEKLRRLKEEGKILTPRQKQEQKRMQAMLEHLKAQGVTIPESGRSVAPLVYKKKKRKQDQGGAEEDDDIQAHESDLEEEADSEPDAEMDQASEAEPIAVEKQEDNVVDEWDQLSESEEENEDSHTPSTQESVKPMKAPVVEEVDKKKLPETEGDDEHLTEAEKKRERAIYRLAQRKEENEKKKSLTRLRAPVVCVLGHVDHGKTKILDKLRRTNVQEGEVGGITQQIGATNVPFDAINTQTRMVKDFPADEMTLPGLLIIDTPGHESFSNLRSRGSSLCDIAILVVDVTQGLEPQTIESINLLKSKKTPFIVALNKVDRVFEWESYPTKDIREGIKGQNEPCKRDFERRSSQVIQALNIQGLNAALFWENPDPRSYVSLVPTSAISGDGMGNLMALISIMCQKRMASRLMLSDELQCTVLEVKTIQGHGTTIDVILVNGRLREGDTIVLAGTEGPIVTQIRSLLIPKPMKEIRVKGQYDELKEVQAALGVKIAARDLEKAIAGLNLQVAYHEDEVEILKDDVDREFKTAMRSMKVKEKGVYVQASTLGALEALLEFFKANKVPYAGIRVGPVVKRDVMKATAMLEHDPMYAVILAFDVKVERDAQELADKEGIKIFSEETIYHLGDRYVDYIKEYKKKKQDEFKDVAVFPCRLKILGDSIFNKRDPIVLGVSVDVGILRTGTPLCVPSKEFVEIGVVTSLEYDHKPVEIAKRGVNVCMKVEPLPGHTPKMFGRHFDVEDTLVSKISRESIDACKEYFRDDLGKAEWKLMAELKKEFAIL